MSATATVTMPAAATWVDGGATIQITIKNISNGAVVRIEGNGSEEIDNELFQELNSLESVTLVSNGTKICIT